MANLGLELKYRRVSLNNVEVPVENTSAMKEGIYQLMDFFNKTRNYVAAQA